MRPPPSKPSRLPRLLYLRSLVPPTIIYLVFLSTLAAYLLLVHAPLPGKSGRMSWQVDEGIQVFSPSAPEKVNGTAEDGGEDEDEEDGWAEVDGALPLQGWDPLLPHKTGLTALAVKACIFSPSIFPDICAPDTTPDEDARLGKWVRVDKDLNKNSGLWYLNLYYRRSRRFDVPYITSIVLLEKDVPPPVGFLTAPGDSLHSGSWPQLPTLSLAYKLRYPPSLAAPLAPGDDADDAEQDTGGKVDEGKVITELDVLYGDGEPWWGFEKLRPLLLEKTKRHERVGLVVRYGVPDVPKAPDLRMSANGTFRILQVADLHYSVGDGLCRDTPKSPCVGDVDTASLLARVLDAEKPDLVVFSGDQLNGQDTSWDAASVLAKFAKPVIDRKIPWAAVFGNHDAQDGTSKADQMKLLSSLPYSLAQAGPRSIDGVGNYLLKIYSADASRTHLASVYLLDSGDYIKSANPFKTPEYDYLRKSQIDWYLSTSASVQAVERPFVPDGADDLGGIWRRQSRPARLSTTRQNEEKTLNKPNALMFFHIPLQEHTDTPDLDPDTGVPLDVGLIYEEGGSSKQNAGFFWEGLKQSFSGAYSKAGVQLNEVKVIGNGHVHTSENCRRVSGIWHCFGGGGSYSGYGRKDLSRRFRVYDISEFGERISTHKHTEDDEIVDRQDLFGGDAPEIAV